MGQELAPTTNGPTISISVMQKKNSNLTACGYINGRKHILTIDTGASQSIIRPDIIKGTVEPLTNIKLRTATGEPATVYGKIKVELTIGNMSINHVFIVADIVDEVIIGADFMISHGINLNMGQQIMIWRNVEIPLNVGYESKAELRKLVTIASQKLPPQSETLIWAQIKGDCADNSLWVIESTEIRNNIITAKALVTNRNNQSIPVRVLNLSSSEKVISQNSDIGQCTPAEAVINCEVKPEPTDITTEEKELFKVQVEQWIAGLTPPDKNKAKQLFKKYTSVFALKTQSHGKTAIVKHEINTGEARPIKQAPRSVPLAKRKEVKELVSEMERSGIIEPSSSPWSSPVVLVKKKDGSTRFCVDYRKLNDVTKKDSYPLPRIDDTLDTLAGTKWFSTLDLQSGYWQVEIADKDKEKTAFSACGGLWQFKVMPFGLCNAPATFERLMEHVLKGLHWKACLVYLDDIIVMGKTFDEHLKNLEDVFKRISAAGLKLSVKKCSLFQKEVKYLGHRVTANGISTDEEKIRTVKEWPRPKNLHELRSFLGLCTYYRRFVPNFANVASALHELTKKSRPYHWGKTQEKAFQDLKELLCKTPVLGYPIPGEKFVLDSDASGYGIGGVLSQIIDGTERVIGYYSRVLSKAEKNYCVTRRELLAVVECIKHYHKYLYGQHFTLRTDHSALRWLLQFKNPEDQIARWIERLESYDFNIEHRKGGKHNNADALSRRPCNLECKHCTKAEQKEGVIDVRLMQVNSTEDWSTAQRSDPVLVKIIEAKEKNERPTREEISSENPIIKAYWAQWNSLKLVDGCLYRTWESADGKISNNLIVVPSSKISEILKEFHNGSSGGHLGITKTLEKLKQRFYWVGCQQAVADWIANCAQCIAAKGPLRRSRGQFQQYNSGAPFERVAMDVAGPFPVSNTGNRYVLVVIDYFSKWPEVYAIPNQEAKTVSDTFVNNWVCRYGVPIELHSDQGRNFESALFKEMCELYGIRKTRTTPLHPQSDGMVERFNRTLEEYLRKVVSSHQKDWDEHIPKFLMAYRSAVHDSTLRTPAKILFGTDLKLPGDLEFGVQPASTKETTQEQENLHELHEFVRSRIKMTSDKMKARYDRAANSDGFNEGQLVLLYNPQRKIGLSPKLQTHWDGPYRIIKRLNDVVYRIQKHNSPRSKMKVVHLERLAKYGKIESVPIRDEQA